MKFSSLFGILLAATLSAKVLTINSSGEYNLKSSETVEHGYKVATELAKQLAIEQAGTAVVSNFKIVRSSDGTDTSSLNASTYAAAVVKTEVIAKTNDGGRIRVRLLKISPQKY